MHNDGILSINMLQCLNIVYEVIGFYYKNVYHIFRYNLISTILWNEVCYKISLLKWHNLTCPHPNASCHILMRLYILVCFLTNTIDQAMCIPLNCKGMVLLQLLVFVVFYGIKFLPNSINNR